MEIPLMRHRVESNASARFRGGFRLQRDRFSIKLDQMIRKTRLAELIKENVAARFSPDEARLWWTAVQVWKNAGKMRVRGRRDSGRSSFRNVRARARAQSGTRALCARDFIGRNRAWIRAVTDVDGEGDTLPFTLPVVRRAAIMKQRLITAAGTVYDYVENGRRAARVYFDRDETRFTGRVSHANRMGSRHTVGISEFSNAHRASRYNNPE